tara:strand:- start:74 stop:496 length:423 start_codon:yes stop_codon:yes gene_type:complete
MKKTKPAGPTFRKGDLVQLVQTLKEPLEARLASLHGGLYLLDNEARQDWYALQKRRTEECIAAGGDPFSINRDSAGETRLAPKHRWQALSVDAVYQVLRGRCRVEYNYSMVGGKVLILDTTTGRELYCNREILQRVDKRD